MFALTRIPASTFCSNKYVPIDRYNRKSMTFGNIPCAFGQKDYSDYGDDDGVSKRKKHNKVDSDPCITAFKIRNRIILTRQRLEKDRMKRVNEIVDVMTQMSKSEINMLFSIIEECYDSLNKEETPSDPTLHDENHDESDNEPPSV